MQERDEVIMAKKLDFDKEKNNRNDNAIEEIMQAEFPLPKQAEDEEYSICQNQRNGSSFWKCGKHREYGAKIIGEINKEINRKINRKFREKIIRNSKIAQEIQSSIQNSFGTDRGCSRIFRSMYYKSCICREYSSGFPQALLLYL